MAKQLKSDIEVFADIPFWVFHSDHGEPELAHVAIAELVALSGKISVDAGNGKKYPIQIESFPDASKFKHLEKKVGRSSRIPCSFLRLHSQLSYSTDDLKEIEYSGPRKISLGEREQVFLHVVCYELHATLIDLFLASSIARPGAFYLWQAWLFADRKFAGNQHGAMTSFRDARKRARELQWPPIEMLKTGDVYKWLQEIPGFFGRRSSSRVGRAIAALTHLVTMRSRNENAFALVWALLGLEAIYCNGNIGLKSQLLEKSEAFLGARKENKKRFGWMYDFRSRLIHGDMDIFFQHNGDDAGDEFEKMWNEINECEALATAVLLATLQRLCVKKIYSIEFQYSLK